MFRKLTKGMVALIVMLTFNFVGYSYSIAQKHELVVWGYGGISKPFWEKMMHEFETRIPHVKIRYETPLEGLELSQSLQKLRITLQQKAGPDVVFSDAVGEALKEVVKTGNVLNLDDAYERYGWNNKIYESAQRSVTVHQKKWAIPLDIEIVGYFYNKNVFEKLGLSTPDTIDAFMSLLKTLTNAGYYGTAIGLRAGWPSALMASEYMYISAGTEYIAVMEGRRKWVDSEKCLEGLKVLRSLVDKGYTNPFVTGIDYNQARDLFFTEKASTILEGPWFIQQIKTTNPEFKVGFFSLPPINPDTDIKVLGGIGTSIIVTTKTKPEDRELAFQLLNFIISPYVAERYAAELGGIIPIDFPLTKETPSLTREIAQAIRMYGKTIGYWPVYYLPAPLFSKLNSFIQGMMAKKITPFDVLKKMDKAREDYEKLKQK